MSPWDVKGHHEPSRWERLVWHRRWLLWSNERVAREERQIEEANLRRMQNG